MTTAPPLDLASDARAARSVVGAGWALVVISLAVASFFIPHKSQVPEPVFRLDGGPQARDIVAAEARWAELKAGNPLEQDDALDRVMRGLTRVGELEVAGLDETSPDYKQASELFANALSDYWGAHGKEGFQALTVYLSEAFVDSIKGALAAATEAKRPIRAWMAENPDHRYARGVKRFGGNFIDMALRWGLIRRNNTLPRGGEFLLRVEFKLRLSAWVPDRMDYQAIMEPSELVSHWRFRIEGDLSIPMKQRLKAIERLMRFEPEYPKDRVLGAVYGRLGRYRAALYHTRRALAEAPFDDELANDLEFLVLSTTTESP